MWKGLSKQRFTFVAWKQLSDKSQTGQYTRYRKATENSTYEKITNFHAFTEKESLERNPLNGYVLPPRRS